MHCHANANAIRIQIQIRYRCSHKCYGHHQYMTMGVDMSMNMMRWSSKERHKRPDAEFGLSPFLCVCVLMCVDVLRFRGLCDARNSLADHFLASHRAQQFTAPHATEEQQPACEVVRIFFKQLFRGLLQYGQFWYRHCYYHRHRYRHLSCDHHYHYLTRISPSFSSSMM